MRFIVVLLLTSSCASVTPVMPHSLPTERMYKCDSYARRPNNVPYDPTCDEISKSSSTITLHTGDLCKGEVESTWFAPRWLIEVVVTSRGFCGVGWDGDVMKALYCGNGEKFHAPSRLKWVLVKHVRGK